MHFVVTFLGYKKEVCLFFSFFFSSFLFGQLKADFTVDKTGGCSPLTVSFKNTTTGASAGAKYNWVLGNGNTSTLTSPGATYREEKTYTVSLTVTDGGQTSTASQQITVFKKPAVDFSVSKTKGCLPLAVDFTSSSAAGDGTISSYFWDFGDGVTEQTTSQQYAHTYNFATKASVSLTVTNSNGCFNTATKPDLVEILPAIHAGFNADKTVLCKVTDAVKFTNTSTGPSDITYLWDFGNGQTSTEKSPSFVYNQKGVFDVKLTVKSSSGCTETFEQKKYVNVADFKTDFSFPALICENNSVRFNNTSNPNPNSSYWLFENTYTSYGNSPDFTFTTPGTHTVKLTNTYGTCEESVTKNVTVKKSPVLTDFVADLGGTCGAPVTVSFKDTSKDAVSWAWNFNYPYSQSTSTLKEPSFTYTSESYYNVALTVKNSDGCSSIASKYLYIFKPNVSINIISTNNFGYSGCTGLKLKFAATPADEITKYEWDFGDGNKATTAQPEHTFSKAGHYAVRLSYTTKAGCKDVTQYYTSINIYEKPDVDFSSTSGTTICGQTPVTFSATSANNAYVNYWTWTFGDDNYAIDNHGSTVTHQYWKDTTYTVTLIAANGGCLDTVIKKNYIKVLPPFPRVTNTINTCEDTRGTVTFLQDSKKAISGTWNFGDGSTATFKPGEESINHTYTKTGSYKVVLSATNGQCTVRDSIQAYVLLKQKPVLSSLNTEVCGSDRLDIKITNLDTNPYPFNYYYYNAYFVGGFQYGDGTPFNGYISTTDSYWKTVFNGYVSSFENGQKDLRAVISSGYFGCIDTTNFITMKIKGPEAAFAILNKEVCYKSPVVFDDKSKANNNVAIKSWEWSFGNGEFKTVTSSNNLSHTYSNPGNYYPTLKVTDNDGCTSTTAYYATSVVINGPKAQFSYSPGSVTPNTTVYFYNNTVDYNYSSEYKWILPDGSVSTNYYPSYTFTKTGADTVKLLARNPSTGCTDTAVQVINVKNINAAFTYTTSYIQNNSCPPVVVKFTNTSLNANSVSWDFGDGSTADNQNNPSHTYYNPGVYYVTIYVNGNNGVIDSTMDSVTVKGPYALLHADIVQGCSSQTVTLTAEVKNAVSYTWDFGDGSLKDTKDTFAVHQYLTAGIYTPALILKDGGGCSGLSELPNKIIIDSLNIAIRNSPDHICDSAQVFFNPEIISLAADELQQPLDYKWQFMTGRAEDTANIRSPYFKFNTPGKYAVNLKVTSPYGCVKETTDTIEVFQKANGFVKMPSEICQGATAEFTATADLSTNIGWKWTFNNGNTSTVQNPALQKYNDSGTYTVTLIVENSGCYDTVTNNLIVRPLPNINLTPDATTVCLGKSVQLTATGGNVFSWRSDEGLSAYTIAQPLAAPVKSTTYKVEVTNNYGCKNTDSVLIGVAAPFKIQIPGEAFICQGKSLQLTASGAESYKWINNTTGINNTNIANPVVNPAAAIVYTVVGYDAFNCFTDTGTVRVNVAPLPTINAGPDLEMLSGASQQLQTTSSSDVIKWNWSPADFLSCANCPSPVTAPGSDVSYVVTGSTQHGCTNSDTLNIKLLCDQSHVYIPTAFTPNGDYKNDLFYVKGRGVKMVKSIKIFNRFGEAVFEKINFSIDDPSSGWNGKYKGLEVGTGAYVYFTEMLCANGETFSFKGTVMVVR